MKGISKALLGLGAVAVMVLASMPVAEAQCASARTLGAGNGNNTNSRIRLLPPAGTTFGLGNEQGTIWQVGKPATNSNGPHIASTGLCPSVNWFASGGMFPGDGNAAINATLASPTCLMSACPDAAASMISVVEVPSDDGSDAALIVYQVDETPAGFRLFDHARTVGNVLGINAVQTENYPVVDVVSSAGPVPTTTLTNNYADVAINVESAFGAGDAPGPASGSILSYDIMQASSPADPGRVRAAYTLLKSIPYGDAAVAGDTVAVPCGADVNSDTWVAVGVTFVDEIPSVLVGRAIPVECNPAHADPDDNDGLKDRKRIQRNRPRSIRRSR